MVLGAVSQSPHTIVGLGELLWDRLPGGERLGGAPANVVYHASVLGDRGVLATRVGADAAGDEALRLLGERGVDVSTVQRDTDRATGTACVSLSSAGEPGFTFDMTAAWTGLAWTDQWRGLLAAVDVLCFGTLLCSQPAGRDLLRRAARVVPAAALRLLDLNLRLPYTTDEAVEAALACANALKLSEEEARALAVRFGVVDAAAWLVENRGLRIVAVTRGARGSLLYTAGGRLEHHGAPLDAPEQGADPVGAGDAFTAALVHHLVRGHSPQRAGAAANRYAAFVASRAGAMPDIPEPVRWQVRRGGA